METKTLRQKLTELIGAAKDASQEGWGPYSANIPFYAVVNKPRGSLSKHDNERPTYWHYKDALWVAMANPAEMIPILERLQELIANDD